MGSSSRWLAADNKGRGLLYEKDDQPIKLLDRDDSYVIKDFGKALIEKILNPKKTEC